MKMKLSRKDNHYDAHCKNIADIITSTSHLGVSGSMRLPTSLFRGLNDRDEEDWQKNEDDEERKKREAEEEDQKRFESAEQYRRELMEELIKIYIRVTGAYVQEEVDEGHGSNSQMKVHPMDPQPAASGDRIIIDRDFGSEVLPTNATENPWDQPAAEGNAPAEGGRQGSSD